MSVCLLFSHSSNDDCVICSCGSVWPFVMFVCVCACKIYIVSLGNHRHGCKMYYRHGCKMDNMYVFLYTKCTCLYLLRCSDDEVYLLTNLSNQPAFLFVIGMGEWVVHLSICVQKSMVRQVSYWIYPYYQYSRYSKWSCNIPLTWEFGTLLFQCFQKNRIQRSCSALDRDLDSTNINFWLCLTSLSRNDVGKWLCQNEKL